MTPEKILSVVTVYEERLHAANVPCIRMDPDRTFASLTQAEILAHAHHLVDNVKTYAKNPELEGKTWRHLAALQLCLSFANWYTLKELMNHNREN